MSAIIDDPDGWAAKVFTETEIAKLKAEADAIIAAEEEASADIVAFQIETWIQPDNAERIVEWCRETHQTIGLDPAVSDVVFSLGANICFAYLTDADWPYSEPLTDHAFYFGVAVFTEDEMEDGEDD